MPNEKKVGYNHAKHEGLKGKELKRRHRKAYFKMLKDKRKQSCGPHVIVQKGMLNH